MRGAFAALALAGLLLTTGSALPATERQTPTGDAVLADAEALVAALSDGPAAERLLALAAKNGITPTPGRAIAVVPLPGLPAELDLPVQRLWAATVTADAWVQEAIAPLTATERHLFISGEPFAVRASPAAPGTVSLTDPIRVHTDTQLAALAAKVDMGLLVAAAELVLRTIDETVPLIPVGSVPANADGPGACATGPAIHDAPGQLAIDGPGSARFTQEYLLTIDLGGNDCYDNRAGAGLAGVAVALDLGGDDVYIRSLPSGPVVAQGAASIGVGVLFDAAGNDRYEAMAFRSAPQPGPVAESALVIAQGAATLGVGVLVDGTGVDTLRALSSSSGNTATTAAQGGAALAGVALLVSGGQALDAGPVAYDAHATSTLHLFSQTASFSEYTMGPAFVQAQGGAALGGAGALVDATGNDAYRAFGSGITSVVGAQGGANGGVGVLVDAAGGDSYDARATGDVTLSLIASNAQFCWTVTVNVGTASTDLSAQGGALVGVGVLADGTTEAGADRMDATALSRAVAHAQVALSAGSFCLNNAHATASSGGARIHAQGAGSTGVGVLLGSVGDNVYRIDGRSDAQARALVTHGGVGANTASASSGAVLGRSHGAGATGAGLLVDPSGNDVYARAGLTTATRTTTTGGTLPGTSGPVDLASEGWTLTGVGWLVDLDGMDTYATAPLAGDDRCWTQPSSGTGLGNQARGRDLSPPYAPLPASCP